MKTFKLPEPHWIRTHNELQAKCADWLQEPFLAVDTEFIRTKTFYPEAGLLQVADSRGSYLIDPLLIHDWQPLIEVFIHPLVVKVFHACMEDMEVCKKVLGVFPSPIADTQMAAAFAGLGGGLGFQRLLELTLDIYLPKEETRSDWLERPLSAKQIQYATADVHFLYKLYPKLMKRLHELGRAAWLVEDSERLIAHVAQAEHPELYYLRIKQAWKLAPQSLLILQQLSLWREKQARLENVPRNKVIDGEVLWNIARFKANNAEQFLRSGVTSQQLKKYQDKLVELVTEALALNAKFWPKPLPKPFAFEEGMRFKLMRRLVNKTAQELDIPAELLVSKKNLETLLRSGSNDGHYRLPPLFKGWRHNVIGQPLLDFLCSDQSLDLSEAEDD